MRSGKIRKFDISPKNQEKIKEFEKIVRLEMIFMLSLKTKFLIFCHI